MGGVRCRNPLDSYSPPPPNLLRQRNNTQTDAVRIAQRHSAVTNTTTPGSHRSRTVPQGVHDYMHSLC